MKKSSRDRIIGEYNDLNKILNPNLGLKVGLLDDNDPTKWILTITGPKNTPYKDGVFNILIDFPQEYPEKPPEVCFLTPIYHVNINHKTFPGAKSLGQINSPKFNFLKSEYTMKQLLLDIFQLFYMVYTESPIDYHMADEYIHNKELYEKKIRYFTQKYANPFQNRDKRYKNWNFDYPYNV